MQGDGKLIQCTLCEQQFDEDDDLLEVRKARHREFHKPRTSKNIILGDAEFIKI